MLDRLRVSSDITSSSKTLAGPIYNMTKDEKDSPPPYNSADAADDVSAGKGDVSATQVHAAETAHRPLPEVLRDLSPEELKALEKKLVRKVDIRLLPTMILICK